MSRHIINFNNGIMRTEEETIKFYTEKFEVLNLFVESILTGNKRCLSVRGDTGMGKSETVLRAIKRLHTRQNRFLKNVNIIKGSMSAVHLYCQLYLNSDKGQLLVFDDCDDIIKTNESRNLLKGAMDSGENTTISWMKDSKVLKESGIPTTFTFCGSIIIISNLDIDNFRGNKKNDVAAVKDRGLKIDIEFDNIKDKLLWIKKCCQDGILSKYSFRNNEVEDIIEWLVTHQGKLSDVSIRTIFTLADMRKDYKDNWKKVANHSLLKH